MCQIANSNPIQCYCNEKTLCWFVDCEHCSKNPDNPPPCTSCGEVRSHHENCYYRTEIRKI